MGEAPRQEHVVRRLGRLSPLKYGGCDGCRVPGILPPAICSGLGRTNCHLLFEKPKPAVALLNSGSYSHFCISNLPNISVRLPMDSAGECSPSLEKVICSGLQSQMSGLPMGVPTSSLGFLSCVTCLAGCGCPCWWGDTHAYPLVFAQPRRANLTDSDLGEETRSSPRGDDGRARSPMLSGAENLCPKPN